MHIVTVNTITATISHECFVALNSDCIDETHLTSALCHITCIHWGLDRWAVAQTIMNWRPHYFHTCIYYQHKALPWLLNSFFFSVLSFAVKVPLISEEGDAANAGRLWTHPFQRSMIDIFTGYRYSCVCRCVQFHVHVFVYIKTSPGQFACSPFHLYTTVFIVVLVVKIRHCSSVSVHILYPASCFSYGFFQSCFQSCEMCVIIKHNGN